ncbi:MAG: DNA-methyltransferase [Gammaproteobacteria bacterium]
MAQLPAATFDVVFADPPYGLSNGGMSCHAGRRVCVNKGEWDKSRGAQGDFDFHREWISACRRLLKDDGSLWVSGTYHSIYACGFALQQGGWHILNDITWYKPNAAPHLACRMFAASHESLVWARKHKKAKHYFDYALMRNNDWNGDMIKKPNRQMRSVWAINTAPKREKKHGKHPTQKPLALLERVILSSSRTNGMVLDPFCGSATTGVAAIRHGRRFVGIDTNREYLHDRAIPRLSEEVQEKRK